MNGAVRGRPQTVRALAAVVLRTLFSDPAALFFMIVLPVMVTVVVGSAFGGQQRLGVGVVESGDSDLGDAIVAALRRDDNLRVETLASRRELSIRLGRQQIAAGVVIPDRLGDPDRVPHELAFEVLVVARDAGVSRLGDREWLGQFARAVTAALSRPVVRIDLQGMTIAY